MADRISIGTRDISKRALYGTQISLLIFGVFFVSDLVYYLIRRTTFGLVALIISSVLLGLTLIGLMFSYSNYRTNKKSGARPLIEYDESKHSFVVYDLLSNKEIVIPDDKLVEIMFPVKDVGTVSINYINEKGKKTFVSIGIGRKSEESEIRNLINQYSKVKI